MSEEKKYLDEEDVLEETPEDSPEEEEPTEPEPEVEAEEEPSDEEVEGDAPVEEEPEEDDSWMERAKKSGWVPDHVREKHAREAQTLREQNQILQRILDSSQREEIDPNEVVRYGDLDGVLDNIEQNMRSMRDPAVLSEMVMRTQVADYDDVVVNFVEPLADQNPWLEALLRKEPNPAAAAYKLGCALRDGRGVSLGFKDGEMAFEIEEATQPTPKRKDLSRPPVEALEQAKKQPKSLDEIPVAADGEATQMNVEDFWKLPSDTLMRYRQENPELYQKMRDKFNEKYG